MAVSFGLGKKIIEHPIYNLSLALPFVAAFYVLNDQDSFVIPVFKVSLGEQLSMAIKIVEVAVYYAAFLFTFVLAGGFSGLSRDSRLRWVYPLLILTMAAVGLLTQHNEPRFHIVFGALALIYLVLAKFDEGNLSLVLIGASGTLISLWSFVAGILWFDGHPAFSSTIAGLFGFSSINADAAKLAWPMLITTGYVVFYAVFQTGELWDDKAKTV
jgi:hypothetical protein